MTTGRSLFSLFPPAFATVPHDLVHVSVDLLSLTEPDKRLSHTSGSSVCPSVRLRSTTRVQVFAEPGFRPLHPGQGLAEALPGVCPALALAVEPFEQDSCSAMNIVAAPFQVIRYGVVAQMAQHSNPCLPEHLSFPQYMPGFLRPVGEPLQALPQLLTAGPALHLKVSLFGFSTIMRQSQKGELLGFLASLVCVLPSKSPEFDASCFLLCLLQPKPFEPVLKTLLKTLRIVLVLKAGYKIISEAEVVRLPSTLPAYPPAEPQVQHVVQVDIRQQWRQNRTLWGPFLARMHQAFLHDATLEHPNDQPDHALIPDPMPQKFDHPLMVDPIKGRYDILPTSRVSPPR